MNFIFRGIYYDTNIPNFFNERRNFYLYVDYNGMKIETIISFKYENGLYSTDFISVELERRPPLVLYDVFEGNIIGNSEDEIKAIIREFVLNLCAYRNSICSFIQNPPIRN